MSEKTVWVIMERSYEYNDETYEMTDGGNAIIAYNDFYAATNDLEQKMFSSIKEGKTYMYFGSYIRKSDEFCKMLERYGHEYGDLDYYDSFEEITEIMRLNASDDDIKIFIEHLSEPLYYLEPVKLS